MTTQCTLFYSQVQFLLFILVSIGFLLGCFGASLLAAYHVVSAEAYHIVPAEDDESTSRDALCAPVGSGISSSRDSGDTASIEGATTSPKEVETLVLSEKMRGLLKVIAGVCYFFQRSPTDPILTHRFIAGLSEVKEDGPEMTDAAEAKKLA